MLRKTKSHFNIHPLYNSILQKASQTKESVQNTKLYNTGETFTS